MYHHYLKKGVLSSVIDTLPYEEKELMMASAAKEKEEQQKLLESGVSTFV
ncbi:hypothetical protein [Aneurinibacillus migulanus]|nr:hypothetical protein [Aneurinibacillus migulanus]MED0892843.1 hypothetical protein [Aneurinibacillus migulanus]MED1619089.1 hypothetical protein [Aneurinibacillus migulanus]GED13978.1 hypothetical protein AMI01nite_19690 [Aneurinibacillus migulanus]